MQTVAVTTVPFGEIEPLSIELSLKKVHMKSVLTLQKN